MKAKEVLQILKVTRQTLTKYVKEGRVKVTVKGNGQYDYDSDSVYKLLNKDIERKTYIFGDLLVRFVDSLGTPYYRVSLKPPVFDLEDYDPNHLDMETFLELLEEK